MHDEVVHPWLAGFVEEQCYQHRGITKDDASEQYPENGELLSL
jgi:hypothetical protein